MSVLGFAKTVPPRDIFYTWRAKESSINILIEMEFDP